MKLKPTVSKQLVLLAFILFAQISKAQSIQSQTFAYTGAIQTYTIPTCALSLTFDIYGASGGSPVSGYGGGKVTAVMNGTPGAVMYLFVGGKGDDVAFNTNSIGLGGFNGGGNSYLATWIKTGYYVSCVGFNHGGGGGGASDIRLNGTTLNDRIIVAGGGGGRGAIDPSLTNTYTATKYFGGAGGGGSVCLGSNYIGYGGGNGTAELGIPSPSISIDGACQSGTFLTTSGAVSIAGKGAGVMAGGQGGSNGFAPSGTFGNGGNSISITSALSLYSGGGGGGGLYGGGGANNYFQEYQNNPCSYGAWPAGGGGGSSYVNTSLFSNASFAGGVRIGDGLIVVSYSGSPLITATSTFMCGSGSSTLSLSGLSSYSWSTGSTNSLVVINPSITSTYSLTGLTTIGNCSVNSQITLSVNPIPTVVINSSTTQICAGDVASLTLSGANTYSWSNFNLTSNVVVGPTTTTQYTVTGFTNGCSSSKIFTLQVNPIPIPTLTSNSPLCEGSNLNLSVNNYSAYTWSGPLNFTSSTQTASQSSISLNASGFYTVQVTDALGCKGSGQIQVNVLSNPTISIVGSNTACPNAIVNFSANGANSYTWNTGAFGNTVNVSSNASTTYSVIGNVGICQSNATKSLNVISPSPININFIPSSHICIGNSATLSASGNYTNFNWSSGTSNPFVVTPSVSTNYTVQAFAPAFSCNNTSVITVMVHPNPVTSLNVTSASCGNACNGKVTANSTGGIAPYTYSIANSNCTTMPCTNLCSGLYTIKTADSLGCETQNIFSVANTSNNIIANINTIHATCSNCNNGSLTAIISGGLAPFTYSWLPIGGNMATANNLTPGCYTVSVTDAGGCNTLSWACIGIGTGVEGQPYFEGDFKLYPNPTNHTFNIELNGHAFSYKIYNSLNQLLLTEQNIKNETSINIASFEKGIYFIDIQINQLTLRKKIVKQ